MKQIFNDIRNKVSLCSDEACFMPDDMEVIAESRLKQILDEAEAKWEAVMAELENELKLADEEKERCSRENPLQFDTAKGYATGISNAIEIISGKPIKISEVE